MGENMLVLGSLKYVLGFLCILVVYALVIFSLILSGGKKVPEKNADTLIILGAQVKGTPATPSLSLKERLDTGLIYLEENKETKVIVTGGQGEDESAAEAKVMSDYLVDKGIDSERILLEDKSTRTVENIEKAKEMTALGKTVIVTNDYHMYRALLIAKRQGVHATGLPAETKNAAVIKGNLREILALSKALFFEG